MSENNVNQEAKDQPFEATTYGGLRALPVKIKN